MANLINNTSELKDILTLLEEKTSGGAALPTLTNPGTSSDLLSGKQLIDRNGNIVDGEIPIRTSSNVTSFLTTVTIPAGYYASQVKKTVTDADLTASNIKKGVNIFGIMGTMKSYNEGVIDFAPLYIQQNAPSTNLDSNYGNAQGVYSWRYFDNTSVGTVTYDINNVLVDEITGKASSALSFKVTNNNPYLWATVYVMFNHAYGTAASSLEYRYVSLVVGPGASVSKMIRGSGGFDGYHNWGWKPSYVKWSTTEPVATSEISE